MALIKNGYFQDTYWASRYWTEDYWPEYGTAVAPAAPSLPEHGSMFVGKRRRRRRLSPSLLSLLKEYLELKNS